MSIATKGPLFRSAFTEGACTPGDVLAFHFSQFGQARMADDGDQGGGDGDATSDKDGATSTGEDGSDEAKLGDAGKRALQAERSARQAAEQKVAGIEQKFNGLLDGLKTALGVDQTKGDDPTEIVKGLERQLGQLQHDNLVNTVARRHNVTKETDIELLRSAKDEDVMVRLALRLKPSEDDETTQRAGSRKVPRADRSQGGSGGNAVATTVGAGRDLYRDRHPSKQ